MKILYFSSVSYGWLKQRPQFIAEKLALKHQVMYTSLTPLLKPVYKAENPSKKLKIYDLKVLPFALKFGVIRWLNKIYLNLKIKFNTYDLIVVTHPVQTYYLPQKCKVIYECMDSMEQFYEKKARETVIKAEKKLCNEGASHIIVSSDALKRKFQLNFNVAQEKITVIKNAVDKNWVYADCEPVLLKSPNMVYVGTVSEWFDYDIVEKFCKKNSEVTIYIVGENSLKEREFNAPENMIFTGKVEHTVVKKYIVGADVLMMPFKKSELTENVDPVKMYEYRAFNKPILASYWDELKAYENDAAVYFYHDETSFFEQAEKACKANCGEVDNNFVEKNCWDARITEYEKIIEKI